MSDDTIPQAMLAAAEDWPLIDPSQPINYRKLSERGFQALSFVVARIGLVNTCIINPIIEKVALPDGSVMTFDELEGIGRRDRFTPGNN